MGRKAQAFVVAVWGMGCAVGAGAQEVGPLRNLDLDLRAEGGAVAALIAAQDLFALARAQMDPLAALAAARMMSGIAVTQVARLPVKGAPAEGGGTGFATAADMFDLARGLALDEELAGVVEAERIGQDGQATRAVGVSRGQVGPVAVAPGGADQWDLAFYAGALAEVVVVGDGCCVLDIVVQDAGGQVICQQAGPRDRLYCPFVPRENGMFSLRIANPGAKAVSYVVITN